jgi:ATP-dependent Clp protease ATP-binding subunit ClpA
VLFGKLKKGGMVKVSVSEDGNGLLLESVEERATPPKAKPKAATRAKPKRKRKPAAKATASKASKPTDKGGSSKKSLVPKVPLAD